MDNQQEKETAVPALPVRKAGHPPVRGFLGSLSVDNPIVKELLEMFPGFAAILDQDLNILLTNVRFQRYFSSSEPDRRQGKDPADANVENGWQELLQNIAFDRRTRSFLFNPGKLFYLCYSRMLHIGGEDVLLTHGVNVTEIIKAGQQIGMDESTYRDLSANLSMGLALVDGKLRVLRANRKFETWFGKAEAASEAFCLAMHRECSLSGGCKNCPILRSLKTQANSEMEFSRLDDQGNEQFIRMTACPVPNGDEAPKTSMVVLEDVTRQHLLRDKLLRAQRLEALGTMAGGIAHEVNQPLSAISLYVSGLQMLLQKGQMPSAQNLTDRCDLILQQVQNIRDIVDGMLKLVAHEEMQFASVNLYEALDRAVSLLGAELSDASVTVENGIPQDLPGVRAVPVQMEQVFLNMLKNALHAVPEGSGIIRVSAALNGSGVRVVFRDNGPGVPPESLPKLFDPFFTTNPPDSGRGLGLSIVHAFVKAWGGNISVRSKSQDLGGAEFIMDLRLSDHPEVGA